MEFIAYIYLFLLICALLVLSLILYNIFLKSYRQKNSILFIFIIIIIFGINSFFAISSVRSTISSIGNQINQPSLPTQQNINTSQSKQFNF
jgi:glucan phosphoethanolaminetransferase (alkaline phosphatase superfamily)